MHPSVGERVLHFLQTEYENEIYPDVQSIIRAQISMREKLGLLRERVDRLTPADEVALKAYLLNKRRRPPPDNSQNRKALNAFLRSVHMETRSWLAATPQQRRIDETFQRLYQDARFKRQLMEHGHQWSHMYSRASRP